MKEEKCSTPQHIPEYIPMVVSPQPNKPSEVRSIINMKRRKKPHGWPQCIHKTLPGPTLHNSNLYMDPIEKHLYEEPEERRNESNENLEALEEEEETESSDKYEPMENKVATV